MADKLTQLMIEGLTQAAANRGAYPQFATKSEPGLFPSNTLGKSAAQKCLDDQLLRTESSRSGLIVTEKGLQFLLDASSPKQVLEDFVRVLESRQAQVDELLATTRQMSVALNGLHMSLATILPKITAQRLNRSQQESIASIREPLMSTVRMNGSGTSAVAELAKPMHGRHRIDEYSEELTEAIAARLSDWADSPGVARDCPLPELFRSLSTCHRSLTIGEFHDCLRLLQSESRIYLHPWTGPLYELPEPAFALMCGHEIAYYVSARTT